MRSPDVLPVNGGLTVGDGVFHTAYMSSPCHIELVLSEKESGIKAEQTTVMTFPAAIDYSNLCSTCAIAVGSVKPVYTCWSTLVPWGVAERLLS